MSDNRKPDYNPHECVGYMLATLHAIATQEPGSRGAYQKFALAQHKAKEALDFYERISGRTVRDALGPAYVEVPPPPAPTTIEKGGLPRFGSRG